MEYNNKISDTRLEQKIGFDRIRQIISDRCSTAYAAERAATETFSTSASSIRKRLLLTDEMRLIMMFEDSFPSGGFIDCIDFLKPLERSASAIDLISLRKLKTMLETLRKIIAFFDDVKDEVYPNLKRMSAPIMSFPEVQRRIESIIDRYGDIKDTASDELYSIRKSLREKEGAISRRMSAILKKAQEEGIVDSDAGVAVRDGKMLIPVSAANKKRIAGFIYDESATGKTAFIEPAEVVELDNQIKELKFGEQREILRILLEFTDFLRPYIPDLLSAARYLGEIDFIMAKAQVALDFIAGMPVISDNGEMNLRRARHPLLERALKKEKKEIVPLTATLTPQKHILLISGPNAGGKSVCLKTVGLLQYMFQWGMLIPTSETSEMLVFDRIMVDIGDDQSIDNDLSTYSSFLANMKEMLAKADNKTLVLIDEFGSGTEPAAGGAIAEAILCELDKRGAYGVITTHYTNLKLYASADTGVMNGAMMFDVQNICPLFKLEQGKPGSSFAVEIARKIGLPEDIIRTASEKAGSDHINLERQLREIARDRRYWSQKRDRIRQTDRKVEELEISYEQQLTRIKEERKEIISKAKEEAQRLIADANRQIENTIRTIKEAQAEKELTRLARRELDEFKDTVEKSDSAFDGEQVDREMERLKRRMARREENKKRQGAQPVEKDLAVPAPKPIEIGSKVKIEGQEVLGVVQSIKGKKAQVAFGQILTMVEKEKLIVVSNAEYKKSVRPTQPRTVLSVDISSRKLNFRDSVDVRGMRAAEALEVVQDLVDDALMVGVGGVTILHGKGTGALQQEIRRYLRSIPEVESAKDEHADRGGAGITVVRFKND